MADPCFGACRLGAPQVRTQLKALAERFLTLPAVLPQLRRWRRVEAVVLAYHNVVPDGASVAGERSLHISLTRFRSHLDALRSRFRVVALEDVVRNAIGPDQVDQDERKAGGLPWIALTFDDAYRGTLELAIPELVERGMCATVFVPTGFVGKSSFWWDEVDLLACERRGICLERLKGDAAAIRRWVREEGRTLQLPSAFQRPGDVDALRAAASQPGIRLAPHGARHRNMAALTRAEIRAEILDDIAWFRGENLPFDPWVAYPYGMPPSGGAEAMPTQIRATFLVEGGGVKGWTHGTRELPRVSVPASASAANVMLRASGVVRS
jgi:peptidoglycan/xylan/chitin deacetylase (PgdA/CDA1 family)